MKACFKSTDNAFLVLDLCDYFVGTAKEVKIRLFNWRMVVELHQLIKQTEDQDEE